MPRRSDIEHSAAHNAMQLADGVSKLAGPIYRNILPWAKFPSKPKRYFTTWHKKLGAAHGTHRVATSKLGRPKKIPDHIMLAIAKGPLQQPYYSHGEPVYPLSVAEVSGCLCPHQPPLPRTHPTPHNQPLFPAGH